MPKEKTFNLKEVTSVDGRSWKVNDYSMQLGKVTHIRPHYWEDELSYQHLSGVTVHGEAGMIELPVLNVASLIYG